MRATDALVLTALFPFAVDARAQCPIQAVVSAPYGSICPTMRSPLFLVQFRQPQCAVDITLAIPALLNTTIQGAWIALGLTPQQQIYPQLGGCARMSNPVAVVAVAANGLLTLNVPPGLQPFTFYADGVALYFDTIFNVSYFMAADWGVQITLQ